MNFNVRFGFWDLTASSLLSKEPEVASKSELRKAISEWDKIVDLLKENIKIAKKELKNRKVKG